MGAVKRTTNREYSEVGQAYIDLAEAIGVKYDPTDVEPYLRKFLTKLTNMAIEKAGERIGKLQANVSQLTRDAKAGIRLAEEAETRANNANDRVMALNRSDIFQGLEKEVEGLEKDFETKCAAIAKDYAQQLNPFHQAVEDFLNQMEAHKFAPELQVEPLCRFLESMSYANWQANSKEKEDEDVPKWAKRAR